MLNGLEIKLLILIKFYYSDDKKPTIYTTFTKLYLTQVYEHKINDEKVPIYILTESGDSANEVSIH